VIQVSNCFWNDIAKFEMAFTEWRIFKANGESGHREMKGEMMGDVPDLERVPPFDIQACVERAHKTPGIEWGVLPTLPASPVLMPVKGTMPAALAAAQAQQKVKPQIGVGKTSKQIRDEMNAARLAAGGNA
jgi:hypothetical protein